MSEKTNETVNETSKGVFIFLGIVFIITAGVAITTAVLSFRRGEWTTLDYSAIVNMTIIAVTSLLLLIAAAMKKRKTTFWGIALGGGFVLCASTIFFYIYEGDWLNFSLPLVMTVGVFAGAKWLLNIKKKTNKK